MTSIPETHDPSVCPACSLGTPCRAVTRGHARTWENYRRDPAAWGPILIRDAAADRANPAAIAPRRLAASSPQPIGHAPIAAFGLPARAAVAPIPVPHTVDPTLLYRRFGRSVRHRPACGVICAGESTAFRGLKLMLASLLLSHDVPVTVYDLGFTADQRRWLARQPVTVIAPELPEGYRFETERNRWACWVKPVLLEQSFYDVTIWLDSDIVVDRDISPLADVARLMETVIFPDDFAGQPELILNKPALYEAHPVEKVFPSVNSGVIAYRRGESWVGKAADMTRDVIAGRVPRAYFACWDQGIIKLALEDAGLAPVADLSWNRPGWAVGEQGRAFTVAEVLERCRPGEITHFQSEPKPWANWSDWSISLRPAPGLTVYVLGHDDRVFDTPEREWIVPVNLSDHDPDQAWGECRFFDRIGESLPWPESEYVGLATASWLRKYESLGRWAPWEFGELESRPDTVHCALRTDDLTWHPSTDWVDHMEAASPGIRPLIEELRAVSGRREVGPSAWSNNWIVHREVFREIVAFFREMKAYFSTKYQTCPYQPQTPPRTWAYLGEAMTVHYLASRGDLKIVEMSRRREIDRTKKRMSLGSPQKPPPGCVPCRQKK